MAGFQYFERSMVEKFHGFFFLKSPDTDYIQTAVHGNVTTADRTTYGLQILHRAPSVNVQLRET
jgi:hypothetical protein